MKLIDNKIYLLLLLIAASLAAGGTLAGCQDDDLFERTPQTGNPDVVSFSATVGRSVIPTRAAAEGELFDPLVLNSDEGDFPLYLHTFESDRIGFEPGAPDSDSVASAGKTRGVQVESAEDLAKFHQKFKVHAFDERMAEYIPWSDASMIENYDIWCTSRATYWPHDTRLQFHAVSPASEFANLSGLTASESDGKGSMSFTYKARTSGKDTDAEAQQDLMLAVGSCTKAESDNGKAPLQFRHALSAVKFAVRDVLDGEVVNIKIKGVNTTGDCLYTVTNPETGAAVFDWSNQTGASGSVYSQNFNYRLTNMPVISNPSASDGSQDIVLNDEMPSKTFMLIPQQIPANATIEVTLKRTGVTPETITVSGKIRDNEVTEWKPGHEYVYTISTSADNWVYKFTVTGNADGGTNNITIYSPPDSRFETNKNQGYYDVVSYRYRANNQNVQEPLKWEAAATGSDGYEVNGSTWTAVAGKSITLDKWMTESSTTPTTPRKGDGKTKGAKDHRVVDFYPHYLTTDWQGDKDMQNTNAYSKNSKTKPWDLSTCGGNRAGKCTTANCYVIDRGGWYCFPLVYGNSYENGSKNSSSYTHGAGTKILENFKKHNGNNITKPEINVPDAAYAELVWQDAYNMVSEIEVATITNETENTEMIRFYVDKETVQQGNAIIALYNKKGGTIIWSWHIWVTEHWLDSKGIPHAFSSESTKFTSAINTYSKMRQRGDAKITELQGSNKASYMAPYNIGWCDEKNVSYLGRKTTMVFTQYYPDGSPRTTVNLPVVQDGRIINYKIGNNTYYQFGRKDPQVGFVDYNQGFKASFGPKTYAVEEQKDKTLEDGIKNPHIMYAGLGTGLNDATADYQDWTKDRYCNLWNNASDVSSSYYTGDGTTVSHMWSGVKTVYDPCPPGYMVPNAGVWRVVGKGETFTGKAYTGAKNTFLSYLNGEIARTIEGSGMYELNIYKIWGTGKSLKEEDNAIFLPPTGNRWYSNVHKFQEPSEEGQDKLIKAGQNCNMRTYYAWTSHWNSEYAAYGVAVGVDKPVGYDYYLGAQFGGRRAMARPVRPIREYWTY